MQPLANIVDEMQRLLEAAHAQRVRLRLIGGLAIHIHSPTASRMGLRREYPDIDFVVSRLEKRRLDDFFVSAGYTPDRNFNLLNGERRRIFYDTASGRRIDVFVGDFEMCHKLPMQDRLEAHPLTVPLAELFLSKAQIVELNRKDALDLIALLIDNEVGFGDDGIINLDRISGLCARDWGLYKTLTINLSRLENILVNENPNLSPENTQKVLGRIDTLRRAVDGASKPFLWKLRDRVGTRMRWYTEVEEVER